MFYKSPYQIDYTASGGNSYRLLSRGDFLTADITRQFSARTQTADIIGSTWSYHQARGNASLSLSWDALMAFRDPSAAERELSLHVQELLASRQGVLRLSSAYVGDVATLVQNWTATLESAGHRILWGADNPMATPANAWPTDRTWAAVQYQFTLTDPKTV